MYVCTGIGPGIEHIVQDGVMVHVKPVGNVPQSVRATASRQLHVKEYEHSHINARPSHSGIVTSAGVSSVFARLIRGMMSLMDTATFKFVISGTLQTATVRGYKVFSVSMKMIFPPE